MTEIHPLVKKSRSIRRFDNTIPISQEQLLELIDTARMAPTGSNLQPLKFLPVFRETDRNALFPVLHWAMALPDWKGPSEKERPAGYIVILADTRIAPEQRVSVDVGIAAQTIALAAVSQSLGCCMLGAFRKEDITNCLNLPPHLVPQLVLALGKPAETVVLMDLPASGDTRYYRDALDIHYVPKRSLEDIVVDVPETPQNA